MAKIKFEKMTQPQKQSYLWFKDVVRKVTSIKVAKEYDKTRRRIKEGELVTFGYPRPKTPLKQLKWFDAYPLVMLFNTKGKNLFGVNIHYMTRPQRLIFFKFVIKLNRMKLKGDKRFDLSWAMIKEHLTRSGLADLVIKQYIIARIQKLEYISYDQWKYASELPSEKFVFDGQYSMSDIQAMIRRSTKKIRKSKSVRFGR